MAPPDRSQDVWGYGRRPLEPFFAPRSVAVIGASERPHSVGRTLLENLTVAGHAAKVFPVNPNHASVLGLKCHPKLADFPETPDLAVIATPAPTVPEVVSVCAEAGIPAAVIVSAGFKEIGEEGAALETRILEAARGRMRIVGPNCLGIMSPSRNFNATFARAAARPGSLAFLSQSGALMSSILDWSLKENVGFSAFVSVGSMLDVGWGDLIDHLGGDPETKSLLLYMESVGDARSFLSAAREAALTKPIIILKAGRTQEAAKAATSHTGALAADDAVLDAAFRRAGVLRVDTIGELFDMAEVLGKQPRPRGPRLTIVTNAGGPGVLATDSLLSGGGRLAEMAPETLSRLDALLPRYWSRGNPVDVLGDADPERYARVVEAVADDPGGDGLLVVLTPQEMTDPTETARRLAALPGRREGPVLASWMGAEASAAGVAILNRAGIPTFAYPDQAARAFNLMVRYDEGLRQLYETPVPPAASGGGAPDLKRAEAVIEEARASGRTLLNEAAAKRILAAWGIPVTDTRVASTPEEAARLAEAIGFPVVLKVLSPDATHKTEVGGVRLNLATREAVIEAFDDVRASLARARPSARFKGVTVQPMVKKDGVEVIVGSSADRDFGPVILFGSGGRLVEVYQDTALALPPLTTALARRMMEGTSIYEALRRPRHGPPADLAALESVLVRFSWLVSRAPRLREIEINPLLVSPDGVVALDARAVLHDDSIPDGKLPRPAIRPYPLEQVSTARLKDGVEVRLRPTRPEDEPLMAEFDRGLSSDSRRFGSDLIARRDAHERLVRLCFVDYDRRVVLAAETADPGGARALIGVGCLVRSRDPSTAEFALQVADRFQGLGLGTLLLQRLIAIGSSEGVRTIVGEMLRDNHPMEKVAQKAGFHLTEEGNVLRAVIQTAPK